MDADTIAGVLVIIGVPFVFYLIGWLVGRYSR